MDAEIVSQYINGSSIAQLSRLHGISEYKITTLLRRHQVEIRRDNGQKILLDKAKINSLYEQGKTTKQIGQIFGCSDETIRKYITNPRRRTPLKEDSKRKISDASRRLWASSDYVDKVKKATSSEEYRRKLSDASKKNYVNRLNSDALKRLSDSIREKWADPEYRAKQSVYFQERGNRLARQSKQLRLNPSNREKWIDKIRANNAKNRMQQPRISSTQWQLYYILERSGIQFHKEGDQTKVGRYYVVDCIIPQQQEMTKPLIVEVQGEYWHEIEAVKTRDRQKKTYVRRHTNYDLLELKELNFASYTSVLECFKSFGIKLRQKECSVGDLTIRKIDESEAQMFYSVFHYTSTVRKGAITFGAFHGEDMVAAISYTYPIRQQISKNLGKRQNEVLEISRLARATDVACHNLASYLIGQTRKMLPSAVSVIISYSDSTYGHDGTVYKAAGFTRDRVVAPDYHYEYDGARYHKKTIWDRAKRMKMSEREYAAKHDLMPVATGEKHRWIYTIRTSTS